MHIAWLHCKLFLSKLIAALISYLHLISLGDKLQLYFQDGAVSLGHFSGLVHKAFQIPLKLGLFPSDMDVGANKGVMAALFKKYNTRGDGNMTFNEWLLFAMDNVMKKMVGMHDVPDTFTYNFNKTKEDFIWFIKKE